jgi:hypothetical protein
MNVDGLSNKIMRRKTAFLGVNLNFFNYHIFSMIEALDSGVDRDSK